MPTDITAQVASVPGRADEQRPRVTIGIPVYNGATYLIETLDGLCAQTFTEFEIVISDNASTDGTRDLCERYAARDPRIRYSRLAENTGASRNYNRVVDLARGEYFKWSAADDVIAPDVIEQCVGCLDRHPDVVLSYPRTEIIDAESRFVQRYDDGLDVRLPRTVDRLRAVIRLTRECNAVFGLIRTAALRRTGLIGSYIGADCVLLAELALYGQFAELPETTFYRRVHEAASSSDKSLDHQLWFYDPRRSRRFYMRHWRHHWELAAAIRRSPLPPRDKLRCLALIARLLVANRQHLASDVWNAARAAFRRAKPWPTQ